MGFEWKQQSQDFNKANNEGYVELYLNFYSKQALKMNPVFQLDRLVAHNMNFQVDEFAVKFTTAFKYNIWKNMLCFDVYTTSDEYNLLIDMSLRLIQCSKTLIDSFFDFGQWAKTDNFRTQKPYSPFAKLLDSCNLSIS